jgi:hypothetical protein
MIKIQHEQFKRACNKAAALKPVVMLGAENIVIGSKGAWHVVSLDLRNGSVWAECTCPAGRGDRQRGPLPCYHVAAVMFAFAERALENAKHNQQHDHCCPTCGELWRCAGNSVCAAIDDLQCNDCAA